MRKLTLLIFILCFGSTLSCAGKIGTMKTEVRSPDAFINDAGDMLYVPVRQVTFEVPIFDEFGSDSAKIEVGGLAWKESEFRYNNPDAFGTLFIAQVYRDNYKIYRKNIEPLFKRYPSKYIILSDRWSIMPHYLFPSYNRFVYTEHVIGEGIMSLTPYRKDPDDDFFSLDFSYSLDFVINGYLISLGIHYYDKYDVSVMQAYPQLFVKKGERKYRWASEDARFKLYEILLHDPAETLPMGMRWFRTTYETMLKTLKITDDDERLIVDNVFTVKENLRLRDGSLPNATVITTMGKGTKVRIFERGDKTIIDGIASYWVRVEVLEDAKDKDSKPIKSRIKGWCFGEYLEMAK